MAVPSTITDLSDTAASNFPQDSDSTGATVASLPRAISSIIKKMVIRGSDITVTGSGAVTIPTENNYFVVNGTGFTVSGFNAVFNGRMVTLEFTGALTLTNSASFILLGSDITTASGDVIVFVNETGSTWRLVSINRVGINQLTLTKANNTADGGGQIYLNGATGNRIDFNGNGINPPSFTTRSTGTKMVLYPFVSGATTDFAFGLDLDVLWSSVPSSTQSFKWYAATTNIATLDGSGNFAISGQFSSSKDVSTATGGGQIYLNGVSGNRIDFNTAGVAGPSFTTRSLGTKLVLNPNVSTTTVDTALGVQSSGMWLSVSNTSGVFNFYGGTTIAATLTGAGSLTCAGNINSSGATSGIGYSSGAGGTVTQLTSKSTGVTINKVTGLITTNNAALAAGTVVTFTVTNSAIAATDVAIVNAISGTNGAYAISVSGILAGSFDISIRNLTAGSLSEAIQLRFAIFNSVNA
jgi:hypothetical protein